MEIDLFCIVPEDTLIPRIQENCARYPHHVKRVPAHDGHAVLVGGGPSLRGSISSIRQRMEYGQSVFALNGAAGFLNSHDIVPNYQVLLDPQQLLKDCFGEARQYLIASQCHPTVLAASPREPILWHIAMEGRDEIILQNPGRYCLVGGGYTVGLTSMCLAYAMGYRKLHIYGYDSSVAEIGNHAYPSPGFDAPLVATAAGKCFRTTYYLAKQAMHFPKLCDDLIDAGCLITVECGGFLRAVVDENIKRNAAKAA